MKANSGNRDSVRLVMGDSGRMHTTAALLSGEKNPQWESVWASEKSHHAPRITQITSTEEIRKEKDT
jgi:hypothetical protein